MTDDSDSDSAEAFEERVRELFENNRGPTPSEAYTMLCVAIRTSFADSTDPEVVSAVTKARSHLGDAWAWMQKCAQLDAKTGRPTWPKNRRLQ